MPTEFTQFWSATMRNVDKSGRQNIAKTGILLLKKRMARLCNCGTPVDEKTGPTDCLGRLGGMKNKDVCLCLIRWDMGRLQKKRRLRMAVLKP
jgi:hypothetical protein